MPSWLPVVITVALFVIGAYNGAIGYFLKRHMERVDTLNRDLIEHKSAVADEIKGLRQELTEWQLRQPHEYVLREDWIRYQAAFETKLDRIGQEVRDRMDRLNDQVEAKIDRLIDIYRKNAPSGGDD